MKHPTYNRNFGLQCSVLPMTLEQYYKSRTINAQTELSKIDPIEGELLTVFRGKTIRQSKYHELAKFWTL